MLARIGAWCFRNPRKTVAAWVVVVGVALAAAAAVGPSFLAELQAPESDSRRGFELLEEHFGGVGSGLSGSIVFRSESGVDDPAVRAAMEEMFEEVLSHDGVTLANPYLVTIPVPETPMQRAPHMPGRPQVQRRRLRRVCTH